MGRVAAVAVALILLLILLGGYAWYSGTQDSDNPLRQPRQNLGTARRAFESRRYEDALKICRELVDHDASDWRVWMLAAESATKLGDFDESLAMYARIPNSAEQAATARWAEGEIYLHLAKATLAIERLQSAVKLQPSLTVAHQRLSLLLNGLGRRYEAFPHMVAVIKSGKFTPEDLLLVGNLKKSIDTPEQVARFLAAVPDDLLPTLGTIATHNSLSEHDDALTLLSPLLAAHPDLVEAHVQRGIALATVAPEKLTQWDAELPVAGDEHPDVWVLRARILQDTQPKQAIAACAKTLELDPMHLIAHTMLAKLLSRQGDSQLSQAVETRARQIQQVNIALEQIFVSPQSPKAVREAAELTLALGRRWEAANWAQYGARLQPTAVWPQQVLSTIQPSQTLTPATPFIVPDVLAPLVSSLRSSYELGDIRSAIAAAPVPQSTSQRNGSVAGNPIRLEDVTDALGVNFTFDNNRAAAGEGRRMFETTGGGAGVLDFDNDGRPDLYFAQAGSLEQAENPEQPSDQLFRNAIDLKKDLGAKFENVTAASRVIETQFSQGIAVGDVDGDGFDDVYVCNVGRNSLLLNQGDGSFVNATELISNTVPRWTCSATIVDLDLDGLPEIYNADYVTGDDAYERICAIGGKPRSCPPLVFDGTSDVVLSATDDGRFSAIENALPATARTYSLGVIAFRIGENRRPSVFVAVDQQANLLLSPTADTGPVELFDEALVSGVAYDAAGAAQACMGIATDDVNHDGNVDMFITNFHLEYNTLYIQQDSFFEDRSAASGTVPATRPVLGFGCQFTDFQLDGESDLLVLNGHVDDQSHVGVPHQMPAQVFVGAGGGRFSTLKPGDAGEYFQRPRLGRGLAKLDFDADGREDFVCCDLESPVVVLHGESESVGRMITIALVGTQSDRNAFCSRVTLKAGGFERTQQLVAGGGYQVSNQRVLRFSVPADVKECVAEIQWPNGTQQHVEGLRPGSHHTVVESQSSAVTKH